MYEVTSTYEYTDEENHNRLIITVENKNNNEQFDIMIKDTGLVYVMND